jgi:hypothetical protein
MQVAVMNRPHLRIDRGQPRIQDIDEVKDLAETPELSLFHEDSLPPESDVPPSLELRRLMQNQPEDRQRYLDEIRRRVANGDYLTRDAAERAAESIIEEEFDAD